MNNLIVANVYRLKFLLFVVKVVYVQYNPSLFTCYMLLNYLELHKKRGIYKLKPIDGSKLTSFTENQISDVNNTIVVPTNYIQNLAGDIGTISVVTSDERIVRKVFISTTKLLKDNEIVLSHTLYHNLRAQPSCNVERFRSSTVRMATEVEISLINSPEDWTNYIVDELLKSYFKEKKLVNSCDVIEVSLRQYAKELFFETNKIVNVTGKVYFKCNKVIVNDRTVTGSCFCMLGKTTLKQTTNVQSFISSRFKSSDDFSELPSGLDKYFQDLIRSLTPFLTDKKSNSFVPVFMIEGAKGCGKSILINALAKYFGMHLLTTTTFDLSANVFAQYETKLRNLFFAAKMSAPVIIEIRNFENFGKNNEGAYDDRLIENFRIELPILFEKNQFPVIQFCSSNLQTLPVSLKRLFLKIFRISSPIQEERLEMLKWILRFNNVDSSLELDEIAGKTQGFLIEDLTALIELSLSECRRRNLQELTEELILHVLDGMQAGYNDSLGAPKVPKVNWDDIGGLQDVKEEIIRTIRLPLKNKSLLKNSPLKRTGILLYGPPGTGKTLLAKAVANECGMCFLSVKGPELLNMYVGQSEQNVREVFERGRCASPCVIFFDELDSLAPNRGHSGDSGGVMDRVVSQLAAEMDGLDRTRTVFVVGATNRPDLIDPALLRPGRFDKLVYVGPCGDREAKLAVFGAVTRKFNMECRAEDVIDLCPNTLTGADFYGVCSGAWMTAAGRLIRTLESDRFEGSVTAEDVIVTREDFARSLAKVRPSLKQDDIEYYNQLRSELG